MSEADAALYEAPFGYIARTVRVQADKKRAAYTRTWWRHTRPRPEMWARLRMLARCIVTPEVAKHRLFMWLPTSVVPDHKLQVIACDDDASFGILHSRFHEAWSLRLGAWHGVGNDPRYTISTTFETFPFPDGLTPDRSAASCGEAPHARAIAAAARRLHELRETWLNSPDLIHREPEVAPGFPDRLLPRDEAAARELAKRTLTGLYNARPRWLADAHATLDAAVAAAYGWPSDISDEDALGRLLALNMERVRPGDACRPKVA